MLWFAWVAVIGVLFDVVWLLLLIVSCCGRWWVLFDCLWLVCRLALAVLVVLGVMCLCFGYLLTVVDLWVLSVGVGLGISWWLLC